MRNVVALGHNWATGSTPLFGSPGVVLPVTMDVAESLVGLGSTGVLVVRVAVFVTGLVPFTVTVRLSVALAPDASTPMSHIPVPVE